MKKLSTFFTLAIGALLLVISSCSKKLTFLNSTMVPAAQGAVTINKDDNNNYAVKVKITNLAPPERLQPKRELYVVWIDTKENGVKNVGQLKSNSGFFSDALTGELVTVTPYYPKRVFITAEDKANVVYPGSSTILTTKESD